jgi:hypothetical protein
VIPAALPSVKPPLSIRWGCWDGPTGMAYLRYTSWFLEGCFEASPRLPAVQAQAPGVQTRERAVGERPDAQIPATHDGSSARRRERLPITK